MQRFNARHRQRGHLFQDRYDQPDLQTLVADQALLAFSHEEMALPLGRFCALGAYGLNIIITENLMNMECLMAVPQGLAIWGQGNAAELLHKVPWLGDCQVRYWGDIDEHGFHILARLRGRFPGVRSFMMDLATLERFRHWAGVGKGRAKSLPI